MNKYRIRSIGITIIIVGVVLSISEFLIDNSEVVHGVGIALLLVSFILKR